MTEYLFRLWYPKQLTKRSSPFVAKSHLMRKNGQVFFSLFWKYNRSKAEALPHLSLLKEKKFIFEDALTLSL